MTHPPSTGKTDGKVAWTPGPWKVANGSPFYVGNDGLWIASAMGVRGEQGAANMRLIAAAPDLYEALQAARNLLRAAGMSIVAGEICDAALSKALAQGPSS